MYTNKLVLICIILLYCFVYSLMTETLEIATTSGHDVLLCFHVMFSALDAKCKPFFQYCSDNEDLFGGYDSILGDSSFLAKLDDAEKHMGQLNDNCKRQSLGQDHMPKPAPSKTGPHGNVVEGLTDSILVGCLEDDSFQDLPSSQIEFQQQVCGVNEVDQCQSVDGRHTSTPLVQMTREAGTTDGINSEEAAKRAPKARRSMANAIKMAMLGNAATSSSCAAKMAQQQKDMVVTEEISIAVQTIQAVATETDLGPFFGLPSKVKDLIGRLRGIDDLYGKEKKF